MLVYQLVEKAGNKGEWSKRLKDRGAGLRRDGSASTSCGFRHLAAGPSKLADHGFPCGVRSIDSRRSPRVASSQPLLDRSSQRQRPLAPLGHRRGPDEPAAAHHHQDQSAAKRSEAVGPGGNSQRRGGFAALPSRVCGGPDFRSPWSPPGCKGGPSRGALES